jgi:hypothetical protein
MRLLAQIAPHGWPFAAHDLAFFRRAYASVFVMHGEQIRVHHLARFHEILRSGERRIGGRFVREYFGLREGLDPRAIAPIDHRAVAQAACGQRLELVRGHEARSQFRVRVSIDNKQEV